MSRLILASLLWAPLAYGEIGPNLTGYLNVYDYLDHSGLIAPLLDHHEAADALVQDRGGFRLQLRLDDEISEGIAFDVSLNFEYDAVVAQRQPTDRPQDGFRVYPKEGFIDLVGLGGFDVRAGRQYLFWGRFEWGGVLDLLAPWDFNTMGAEKENFRLAVDALNVRYTLDQLNLTALVLPYFQPTRMALKLPEKIGPLDVIQNDALLPSGAVQHMETALRLQLEGARSLLGLIWYRGYDRIFSMNTQTLIEPGQFTGTMIFTPEYHPLEVFGLEGEWVSGPVVFKMEAGLNLTDDPQGDDLTVSNHNIAWMLGADWEINGDLSLNLQYGQTHLLDYDRQAEYEARAALGEPDPYVERTVQSRIITRIRYMLTDQLKLQIMALVNAPDTNLLGLSFFSWSPLPDIQIYLGSILFRGIEDTTFGRLEGQSRLFSELKVLF
ncbi:OprO/OprP family phosphate-selective porin [Myxococcota bacterium]|nr:OprO/OprP family phosphate-selective porin [Myxococcota bacterium]MBU1433157.1 OprO/OprP family phosphate-selective porin [Myxococcota bacterium]MBU1899324.1 OprO/OprP family phosphate-selective porin [Myxococcota bacterium]